MQRYMALYGATSEKLAAVPIAFRKHALKPPLAVMSTPLTLEDHQASRMVVDPLRLFDCCLITDGAVVALVTSAERARDLKQKPVYSPACKAFAPAATNSSLRRPASASTSSRRAL